MVSATLKKNRYSLSPCLPRRQPVAPGYYDWHSAPKIASPWAQALSANATGLTRTPPLPPLTARLHPPQAAFYLFYSLVSQSSSSRLVTASSAGTLASSSTIPASPDTLPSPCSLSSPLRLPSPCKLPSPRRLAESYKLLASPYELEKSNCFIS